MRSARLIEMDVRIHQAWHDYGIAGIDEFRTIRNGIERMHGGDDPVTDVD